MAYHLPTEIQNIIWTHEFYLVILYIITVGPLFHSSLDYYTHHISPKTIPPKMTKLLSKLNLTKLFYIFPQQDQETIIRPEIFHNHRYFQLSAEVYLKFREGISQIVKCVGVETPHCGDVVDPHCQDVEMWWIHILSVVVHI